MCIMDSGNNNTFNNITANSTGPAWAGVSACKHMAGIAIDSSHGNIIANSTISGNSSLVFLLANGSANTLYNSRLISASGNQTLVHINGTSSNNTFYQNNLTGRSWVNDSGTSNHYNSSAYGNIYYFANGTPSWKVFDIRDTDGQGWADAGSAVPFNNTTVSGYWYGNGADYKPYVPARAFGNSSNVSTTYSNVSIAIGNDTNATGKYLEGNYSVNFSSNSQPILLFDFNFSAAALNFSQINITNGTSGGAAFAQISGINYSGLIGGKTIYLYNASESYNYVCVKDEEGASAFSITSGCSGGNETRVPCSGSNAGYSCNRSGTTLTITGLNHSALIQHQPEYIAPPPSGGSGSYITPSLSYSFNCSSGRLEITTKSSGSPINGLEIKLFKGGTIEFVKSKTGSSGKAQFNINQSRKYYAESVQSGAYLVGDLPSFELKLCPQAPANQSASPPSAANQSNTSNATLPLPPANQTPALPQKNGSAKPPAGPAPPGSQPASPQNSSLLPSPSPAQGESQIPLFALAIIGFGILGTAVVEAFLIFARKGRKKGL
jgi:hypothetical protein